ncbi:MAG: helix-turn-helix domain-containing protein [Fimbriimonadaceae bacterium]
MKTRANLTIDQLTCLGSHVRLSLLAVMRANGSQSLAQLANVLEVRRDRLYYHVHAMEKVGLVVVDSINPAETRPEKIYRLSADEFFFINEEKSRDYEMAIQKVAQHITTTSLTFYENLLLQDAIDFESTLPKFSFASVRLSPEKLVLLKEKVSELIVGAMNDYDADGESLLISALIVPWGTKRRPM